MEFIIDEMKAEDWKDVRAIYLEGIATKNATFEQNAPDWEDWNRNHLEMCRFVARENNKIIGWAALSPVSKRSVYSGVVEVSIYISENAKGKGVGKRLLSRLVEASEMAGIWTLQGGIFPENETSIAIHKACGFRIVGARERVGKMDGVWRDVVLMERRSKKVGFFPPFPPSG
jgi:phosphinothricin acetyltransferase